MISDRFRAEMLDLLGPAGVFWEPEQLRTYESDGLTQHRGVPGLVVLPTTTAEVAAVVRACDRDRVPFVARGAGTGLSGGATPSEGGVVLGLARMRRILELDAPNRYAVVQPGVANADVSRAAAPHGLQFAPDPSSAPVCTIGGNVAENAGGAHCLKYGFTTNHVLGLEVVLPGGEVTSFSGAVPDTAGYDLRGLIVGAEGTLGVVTAATLRLVPVPESVRTLMADFASVAEASEAVAAVIAAGMVPAALEIMDHAAIATCEAVAHAGYSVDAGAILIVEVDGPEEECAEDFARVQELCRAAGATRVQVARDGDERARIWRGRKAAFAAAGRLSPNFFVQDSVVPRTALARVLARIDDLARRHGVRVANVFHAGDGNLHPLVMYDARDEAEAARAQRVITGVAELCVEEGGSITGEHGVGVDKACSMPKMFSEEDLAVMQRVRGALDPHGLANPGKIFPTPRLCGEGPGPYRAHPLEAAGLERF